MSLFPAHQTVRIRIPSYWPHLIFPKFPSNLQNYGLTSNMFFILDTRSSIDIPIPVCNDKAKYSLACDLFKMFPLKVNNTIFWNDLLQRTEPSFWFEGHNRFRRICLVDGKLQQMGNISFGKNTNTNFCWMEKYILLSLYDTLHLSFIGSFGIWLTAFVLIEQGILIRIFPLCNTIKTLLKEFFNDGGSGSHYFWKYQTTWIFFNLFWSLFLSLILDSSSYMFF